AELGVAPVPEQMPVIRNDVVAVRLRQRRTLPHVVVKRGWGCSFFAMANRRPVIEVRRPRVNHLSNGAVVQLGDGLLVEGDAATLQTDLDDLFRAARGGDHSLAF